LGIWQARLVSVLCGLAVLLLTYQLGRMAVNRWAGVVAAAVLCLLPVTITANQMHDLYPGTIPLLDFARVLRYDLMATAWVLAACVLFLWANGRYPSPITAYRLPITTAYLGIGFLTGLATLSHLYGAFILPIFGVLLVWQAGRQAWRPLLLMAAGWGLALLPWIVYISRDLPAYQGQMLRHESRFDLLDPVFYLNNLRHEPWRYVKFLGRFRPPVLWPRPGFWLMVVALVVAFGHLWRQLRWHPTLANRFLLITLPGLALLLALFVSFKRYTYVALLLPFLALQVAVGIGVIWEWATRRGRRWQMLVGLWLVTAVAAGIYSTIHLRQTARMATPYQELTAALQQNIPPDARLLMMHDYWLGLADYEVYSLDLAYNLSDEAFVGSAARPLPQVIQSIAPTHIIVSQQLLKSYLTPETLPGEKVAHFWQSVDMTIQSNCAETVTQVPSQTYGVVNVYHCIWP
jgi:4-amino-4-deoxy-L-arabinose transferase-like glycosyltransferase